MSRNERSVVLVVAALVAASGCSSGPGGMPDAGTDAGVPPDAAPDAAPDAPMLPGGITVTGKWFTRCQQGDRIIDYPFDLQQSVVRALIPDASDPTGYRIAPGTGRADGTFSIPGVPRGVTYLLNRDSAYYVTDQPVIDAHDEFTERCDPPPARATMETPVKFQLTGLLPYSVSTRWPRPGDHLLIFSLLQYYNYRLSDDMAERQTTVDATVDWGEGSPLPEAAHGDEIYVFHYRSASDRDPRNHRAISFTELVGMFRTTATIHDGEPTMVAGAMQPLTPNRSLSFSVDRTLFEAGYDHMIIPQGLSVRILTDRHHEIAIADIGDRSHSTSPVYTLTDRAYADPFPMSWPRLSQLNYFSFRPLTTPGGYKVNFNVANFNRRAFTGSLDLDSLVTVPTEVQLGGMAFGRGGKVPFDGQSPVRISWKAAPNATSYRLAIRQILPLSFAPASTSFRTTDAALTLPAALFEEGGFYMFTLTAIRAANEYRTGQILPVDTSSSVSLISGRFRFQASCGDGVVQAGEGCDTAGESATCNVDCTLATCGDGLHNDDAGEACDGAGRETLGCTRDCRRSVCGDGQVNWLSEDCDDGNSVDDGNGCSSSCKYNNICGNSRVEHVTEQCDDGGGDSATCNADCSQSHCGDGYHNPAAGEECDDGPFDHRVCSPECQLLGPG